MKITLLLAALAGLVAAQNQPVLGENPVKVSEHVWAIMGFPNVAIIVGTHATLVVDTGLGPRNGATVARVAARLESHGRIARGYLGLGLQPVRLDEGVGAMVMNVDKQGPAAAAGIRQGDVIVGFNDQQVTGVRSLARALGPESVGSVVDVAVRRAGEPVQFKLTIGERPET